MIYHPLDVWLLTLRSVMKPTGSMPRCSFGFHSALLVAATRVYHGDTCIVMETSTCKVGSS